MFRSLREKREHPEKILVNKNQTLLLDPTELRLLLERLEQSQQSKSRLSGIVRLGSCVTIRDQESGNQISLTLVNTSDADPLNNYISFLTPLGLSLIGLRIGETAKIQYNGLIMKWDVVSVNQGKIYF
ncbi:GreA/GreB family elongation factor [Lacimicrobium alkaliphilum]|uniref:Transcription elongation factor GreA/GreB C-terminal domain-containing protein n=1 Tax=Lacimicrobium alkaliphilum TaxID=1526571 RepID=A0A0U2QPG0_9ALTE|nr:hypothetical protein AT746_15540 [Lacimicrobium alkaliphilum]